MVHTNEYMEFKVDLGGYKNILKGFELWRIMLCGVNIMKIYDIHALNSQRIS